DRDALAYRRADRPVLVRGREGNRVRARLGVGVVRGDARAVAGAGGDGLRRRAVSPVHLVGEPGGLVGGGGVGCRKGEGPRLPRDAVGRPGQDGGRGAAAPAEAVGDLHVVDEGGIVHHQMRPRPVRVHPLDVVGAVYVALLVVFHAGHV